MNTMQTPTDLARAIVEAAGGLWCGMDAAGVWVTERETKSTGLIYLAKFNRDAVVAKLAEIRQRFGLEG